MFEREESEPMRCVTDHGLRASICLAGKDDGPRERAILNSVLSSGYFPATDLILALAQAFLECLPALAEL